MRKREAGRACLPHIRFILVRPRDPNNIGAAARALANFGFDDLRVVDPYAPVWQEAKAAVGAGDILPDKAQTLDEALAGCHLVLATTSLKARKAKQAVVALPGLTAFLEERLEAQGTVAILFGSEKTGLPNEVLDRCHAILNIPTHKKQPSMNLAQSIVVTAYELCRTPPAVVSVGSEPLPTSEQLDDLTAKTALALKALAYRQDRPAAELSRMFRRWRLSRQDAAFLQGLFKRLA
jgi:TrmH family RNA methyltransferase